MPKSPPIPPAARSVQAAKSAPLPFLLTSHQGEATRRLLDYVLCLAMNGADAQLLATVVAIRAVGHDVGNITGQDLRSLRLGDTEGALAALGWRPAGDLMGGDPETPVAVTVPGLTEELAVSKTARSRVSGWTTRTLASKPLRKTPPETRLAALFLAAHSSSDRSGLLPDNLPEHCHAALPGLLAKEFLVELQPDGRYRLAEAVRHLSGLHPRSHDSTVIDRVRWEAWKEGVSPALRRHAEAVEDCQLCALPLDQVTAAFVRHSVPTQFRPRVRTAYITWKESQPDRGPRAAQFAAAFRAEHGHGPSIRQLCEGLGWKVDMRDLRAFIVSRLVANEWLTNTAPVPWTLRPGKTVQDQRPHTAAAPGVAQRRG